jgi:hypothetical protein
MPLLANSNNDNYDDAEEENGKGETPEECVTILHCVFQDFCYPPPSIGWALSALRLGVQRARGGYHGGVL